MTKDFIYPFLLLIFGIYSVYCSVVAIKTKNLYWAAPTISGFKNRKNEKEQLLWVVLFTGISGILFGVFLIIISIMSIRAKLGL